MAGSELWWIVILNGFGVVVMLFLYLRNQWSMNDLKKTEKMAEQGVEETDVLLKDLEEKKAKDDALLNSLGEGIVVTDQDGNVELINKTAEKLVGWKLDEVVGKKWFNVAPLVDNKGIQILPENRATQRVLKLGQPIYSDKYNYVRRDGTRFPVATTASPVVFGGKIIGVIAVFRDVTHEKEVDQAKSEFVSLASHQLRTPLSAIKWFVEMLLAGDAGPLNPEQTEFATNIAVSNQRMVDLVTSLLNISRIESGRIIINPVPTDLGKLVAEVADGLKKKIGDKKLKLAISVLPGLPLINIDPKLVSQVYMNLLTNSIKYTPDGGEIMVTISRKNEVVESAVSDNGVGIPKEAQKRVFEKFFRAPNAVKMETDGTGLGLYLAKSVVESSGGKIWFESGDGKGTTFKFDLPLSGMVPKEGEVTLS